MALFASNSCLEMSCSLNSCWPALPIELRLGEIGLALRRLSRPRNRNCSGGFHSRLRCVDAGYLRLDVGSRLDVLQMKQDVSLLNVVTLFDHDIRDLPNALAQHICIGLRTHFTRGCNQRDQVLAGNACRLHGNDVLVRLVNAEPGDSPDNEDRRHSDRCLLPNLH